MNDQPNDDLGWQAFRYIAAEMSPDEVPQFEKRLSEDQGCREAVARAVELAEALAVVSADRQVDTGLGRARPDRPARSTWWARVGWVGVGAAAALVCVFLFRVIRSERDPNLTVGQAPRTPVESLALDETEAAQLARLWSRTRDEIGQAGDGAWPPDLVDPLHNEPEKTTGTGAEDASDVPDMVGDDDVVPDDAADPLEAVPSWMLAALAGDMDRIDDGLPQPEEP